MCCKSRDRVTLRGPCNGAHGAYVVGWPLQQICDALRCNVEGRGKGRIIIRCFLCLGRSLGIGIAATRSREAHGGGGRGTSTSLLTLIRDLDGQGPELDQPEQPRRLLLAEDDFLQVDVVFVAGCVSDSRQCLFSLSRLLSCPPAASWRLQVLTRPLARSPRMVSRCSRPGRAVEGASIRLSWNTRPLNSLPSSQDTKPFASRSCPALHTV